MIMSMVNAAHSPKMQAWAKQQIDTKDMQELVATLVRIAETKGAAMQATAVMALCMTADRELGMAWLAIGQIAHSISMSGQERFARYGEKMFPFSEKQLAVVAKAVLQAKEQPNDAWI